MEIESELLRWVQVVQDDESAGGLVAFNIAEVDTLGREGCHRAVVVEVSPAKRQVFIELDLLGLVLD